MALRKTAKADLKSRYPLYVQFGLILSLGLLITVFTIPLQPRDDFEIVEVDQEIVQVEEIEQIQLLRQPPPPIPPPPQEVPDHQAIEEQLLNISQEVDLRQALRISPPPPPRPPPALQRRRPLPPPPELQFPPEPEIFEVVEQMPELEGGIGGLQSRIEYPEMARRAGLEGRVFVQFVVDERGSPSDIRVVRGIGGGCDEAAVAAVAASRFAPGLQRGRPVKVRMSLSVTFRLS